MIKLEDWMSKPVIMIDPKKSVAEAAKLMNEKDIGALVIVDSQGRPDGILTERDILRFVASERDLKEIKVKDVMTKHVKGVDVDSTVMKVSKIMHEHGFRRILVTKNGKAVGIMTDKNLIELMSG